jgi:hypothetical protein
VLHRRSVPENNARLKVRPLAPLLGVYTDQPQLGPYPLNQAVEIHVPVTTGGPNAKYIGKRLKRTQAIEQKYLMTIVIGSLASRSTSSNVIWSSLL